jgi:hypothetical protein
MKYIKKYENKEKVLRYNLGDYVRIKTDYGWKSPIYKIIKINLNDRKYLLETVYGGFIWRNEDVLELVPDYEIDANKYNL